MKLSSSKRRIVVAAALLLLALYVLRPGASRLKSRIIYALSAGMGRPVDVGSVHLQLLPRPGFDLENLVVYDDPAFGAEPMLRASDVTADLRLTSLMRGRLEIARLNLTEPSLNLVHAADGRWNLETLLERTAHTPLAPTAKAKSEPRPGFPYIEATSARINFKSGPEKKPYALTNADFSLWQDSENAWGVRLKAQPVRTDLNLNDTGLLLINGTWQRAAALHDTPLQFTIEWSRAQLGQVTKLLTGSDKGWRGGIQLDVTLTGNPAKLQVASAASVDDFRRYDINHGQALRLAGSCDGEYSSRTHEFHGVKCSAPVATGFVTLSGDLSLAGSRRFAAAVTAEGVPATALVALAMHAKKNLPDDLSAEGTVSGKLLMQGDASEGSKSRFEGQGEIAGFRLSSAANNVGIGPETVPFVLVSNTSGHLIGRKAVNGSRKGMRFPDGPHVEFGPVTLENGKATGPSLRGWVNRGGYEVNLAGEIEIARTLRLARMIGLPALAATPEGTAEVNLQMAGWWASQSGATSSGFVGPQVAGTAKLRNVKIALHGSGPTEILSADMQLLPNEVRMEKLSAKAAGSAWTGSLEMPRGCGTPEICPIHFALSSDESSLVQLDEWAHPSPKKRAWYQVLQGGSSTGPSLLSRARASGTINVQRFHAHGVTATNLSANMSVDAGKLQISSLTAALFGGTYRGDWLADFGVKPAVCSGKGNLAGLSLASAVEAMKDTWIAGTANARYEIKGACSAEFWQSADATLQIDVRDGTLPHVLIGDDAAPLRITHLSGQARLRAGEIEFADTKLDSHDGDYRLSGTATLQRKVALKMTRISNGNATSGYSITGTLAEPRVTSLASTEQARLKPLPSK